MPLFIPVGIWALIVSFFTPILTFVFRLWSSGLARRIAVISISISAMAALIYQSINLVLDLFTETVTIPQLMVQIWALFVPTSFTLVISIYFSIHVGLTALGLSMSFVRWLGIMGSN